ncbi:MAG: molybdopterin molybdotransferase MoeA [Sulfuriflexus sp.]|nr:molybdopterin molybdotransferase MoeA [Sulfuriflexus sp.]
MNDCCYNPNEKMLTTDEAIQFLLERSKVTEQVETIKILDALDRVLAQSITSTLNVPPLDNSAMDGYVTRFSDLNSDGETTLAISQRIAAGYVGDKLEEGTAARIFTGAPVPEGADTIIMQEQCQQQDDTVVISGKINKGDHIRRAGEDIVQGSEVMSIGQKLRPQDMGLIASVGIDEIKVFKNITVAIFSTGDELLMPGEAVRPGKIYNSNRYTLTGMLQKVGCDIIDLGCIPDDLDATVTAMEKAAEQADLIMTTGGVSVGEEDYIKIAIDKLGSIEMWRVAMKPGKPVAFGEVSKTPFIGLPGNPVSVFVTFCLFARPVIRTMQGCSEVLPRKMQVTSGFDWARKGPRREFVRGQLVMDEQGQQRAQTYSSQSSGVLTSTTWAQGLIEIPENTSFEKGAVINWLDFSELFS